MVLKLPCRLAVLFSVTVASALGQPVIPLQPADQTANQGFDATFKVKATSAAPPLQYQWQFNSNALPSATSDALIISKAQTTNAGSYFVSVRDSTGTTTSRVARLTVIEPVPLDPKLSANIRIGEDAFGNRPHQADVQLDRSLTSPNLLLATFDDALAGDGSLGSSYALSKDGGLTWTQTVLPGIFKLSGGE